MAATGYWSMNLENLKDPDLKIKILLISLLIMLLSGFFIWGSVLVPFHPDESTFLYMSSDFELWISQPLSLAFNPDNVQDARQRYRLIDAPLTRYYLGLARSINGQKAPANDWDWSANWEENLSTGSVPQAELMQTSRLAISFLFPFTLLLIFLIGHEIQGFNTGILAVLFLGFNALILVHNRRAMAESWLTLGILLSIWSALQADRRPWLAGAGLAVAFGAKHTGLLLLPLGLSVILQPTLLNRRYLGKTMKALGQFLGVFLILTALLNPVFWRQPLNAARAAWAARTDLVTQQVADSMQPEPGRLSQLITIRLGTIIANNFLVPPAFYEVGNYSAETAEAQATYLQVPGHNLMRSPVGAGVSLLLTLSGLIYSVRGYQKMPKRQKRAHGILWLAGVTLFLGALILVPLPWQRYAVPLIPITSLWAAYSLTHFSELGFSVFPTPID